MLNPVGFSEEGGEQVLVYQRMENGSVEDFLTGEFRGVFHLFHFPHKIYFDNLGCTLMILGTQETLLLLGERVKLALSCAQALAYLHHFANPPMVHGHFRVSFFSNCVISSLTMVKVTFLWYTLNES